jgi:hypothetical protein
MNCVRPKSQPILMHLTNESNSPDFQAVKFTNDVAPERFSGFRCPEWRGPLFEHRKVPIEFRCRVGHIFPLRTLIADSASTRERKMCEAIVSLEEGSGQSELDTNQVKLMKSYGSWRKHGSYVAAPWQFLNWSSNPKSR